jgi:hypothetical protein
LTHALNERWRQKDTSNFMILVRFVFDVPMTEVAARLIGTSKTPH